MRGKRTRSRPDPITFAAACSLIEAAMSADIRQQLVAEVSESSDFGRTLLRLRDPLRSNVLRTGGRQINLDPLIRTYDSRTRQEGFHVLHDWDGKADRVNEDIIPVDVLHYLVDQRGSEPPDGRAVAILLDYYFMHVLSLLSLRIWDDGDADENLDRLNHLLGDLQGPTGSGQKFAGNAETLILIATAHYERVEAGFDALLEKVQALDSTHRVNIALGHAASLGCHLRFGFEATYARDIVKMRDDNVADYPWLCFSIATLMGEYSRVHGEDDRGTQAIVEALLNGLSPDANAFVGGQPPPSLSSCEAQRSAIADQFQAHKQDLLDEFERWRPSDQSYSPLSFFFNFSHNVLKGTVVDALMWGEAWDLGLNDLLTGSPRGEPVGESKTALAMTLMAYARSSPDRVRGRLMPVIVYDPQMGNQTFAATLRRLREQ
jgi:hypothetical protein